MTDGRKKSLVSSAEPAARSRADMTIRTSETENMMNEKTMFPVVEMRARPEGYRLGSTLSTARCDMRSISPESGSKMESAMVTNSDSEPDEMAA